MKAMGAGGWQGLTEGELVRAGYVRTDGSPSGEVWRDFNDVLVCGIGGDHVELKMVARSQSRGCHSQFDNMNEWACA